MKKLGLLFITIGLLFSSCEKEDEFKGRPDWAGRGREIITLDEPICIAQDGETKLIAGQHHEVGTVSVKFEETKIIVTYKANEGIVITETHLHVAIASGLIPTNPGGNPQIGLFDYGEEGIYKTEAEYVIDRIDGEDCYYIAAHAVVLMESENGGYVDLDAFAALLPSDPVSLEIGTFPPSVTSAYFENVSITGDPFLEGLYEGWCVEATLGISQNTEYSANVYSSYDPDLPDGLVLHPENLDQLNWLLNQDFVGKDAGDDKGLYTWQDLQVAIWELVAFFPTDISPDGIGDNFSEDRVELLLELAADYGVDFTPDCGELIVLILAMEDVQNIIITVPLPCFKDETAWGQGCLFTQRGSWAMYFKVCYQD